MRRTAEDRAMGVGFGGNAVFNRASPSSNPDCVARIVAEFLPAAGRPPRLLDIGGTAGGFRRLAALPPGSRLVIANPERGVGADYAYVQDMPPGEADFDLAMLFGVMMYLPPEDLLTLFRDVKQRLRGDGTLLVAEPDPEGVVGRVEVAAKTVYAAIVSLWNPTRFIFHTQGAARALLRQAGFGRIRSRPDLRPGGQGFAPPPQPPYFVLAARI
ncbi:class I SAM-dependent methyltransferase [Falsiroseomonas selenitidurans]|uniref:Class I SAM-dependent methyltransferase n=1 Tax=Falsiroseomonas selenitidurans TaxID=2716335 RepID=A0ABX1DZU4_9PROT|nr:class I SAM-dependent methyltransferase [Falsiroseomonas selenitidurans]NKC30378.1 class I SAM-dependent methyltransferase [Falsiroseomonas selenitidurans]